MKMRNFTRMGRFEFHYDLGLWALPLAIEFPSSGVFLDILCFTVVYRYKVICKSCGDEITKKDIDKKLIMHIKEGGMVHWNCDDANVINN